MNIIYVVLAMFLLGIAVLIILDISVIIQNLYSTVLTLTGSSTSAFNATISPYFYWAIVFIVLGFIIIYIVFVLYEKNR